MPRKGPAKKREITPDPVYGSRMLTRLMNRVLLSGKKSAAEKIVYGALDILADKTNKSGLGVKTSDMRHTGGSFEKNKIADVVITLNPEPRARDTIPLRLYGAKNREEKSGWEVQCEFNRATQTIIGADDGL